MSDQQTDIAVGTQVELLPNCADVYKRAVAGSVGVVKDKKIDEGFEMVFIEWDKDHWRYQGEPDGWTFEVHFQPTEKVGLFGALEDPEQFTSQLAEKIKDEGVDDERVVDAYLDKLNEVVSLLSEADGFIVLAARQEQHPKNEDEQILVPYVFGGFLNEVTMLLLEAQVVQMGAMAHSEMSQLMLERYRRLKEDEED